MGKNCKPLEKTSELAEHGGTDQLISTPGNGCRSMDEFLAYMGYMVNMRLT